MQVFPDLVVELKALVISLGRVEEFMNEIETQKLSSSDFTTTNIGFTGVNVAWDDDIIRSPNDFVLRNINLKFPLGALSGHKSSGKTLLLLSLLRETSLLCGTIHFPTTKVAYVPQQPWLENSTIRENILFGTNFEEERYWNVVDACGLLKDFENMEQADFTEYNDKDLVLSDEQKARIAFARALYSDAQILLLDDFLSIMDSTTARQIIDNCIKSPFIAGRTVIIVTYYVRDLLDISEYVVILGGGTVIAKGTTGQLLDSEALSNEMFRTNVDAKHDQIDTITQNSLNQTDDKKVWTTHEDPNSTLFSLLDGYKLSQANFIAIYALIASASALFIIFRMACQLLISLRGSKTLFSKLLNAILNAPFVFFDIVPLGKVMNRFSKDLSIIDQVSGLTVHYSPNDEPALSDIKFSVKAEEKIGIVGRTAAGKTTLANSFLRLTEATKGRIVIDGIDISTLSLEDLRSRLTIISQDPILFEGTIRSNLDIREEYTDEDLWESLRRVHLANFEEEHGQVFIIGPITSLDDLVSEGGSNFSRGERQLICFARTLLRRSKTGQIESLMETKKLNNREDGYDDMDEVETEVLDEQIEYN
ncbi:1387_t:CDS:2 [Racocetra fulgida]|uniref:1387_t:CDS:1 n=1 Tax=Racocetra fulgida TaxID=60492 RepID=A0A9N9AAQ8_9GLOM|nr:1387_t:CDS:2 [Racocetra fulgida]